MDIRWCEGVRGRKQSDNGKSRRASFGGKERELRVESRRHAIIKSKED